ncbi:hypothetical protein FGSG_11661 [Fusarium graminearum PH-1]|uniref:Chromosome 1, complete genome n=1 Tax=Gibberella zeae (strain ATCC MYA-4620 / CBS 123657 / FGSC 9075 / NRRL 31084 / PH-1) TaxID=229533 RepID=I1S494_GIBZE|nr:hypothetical protein FGSG_11661 [Fusarium graminearum PH-1]ESU05154.1 hypothetical protein FGSG_11661 [Fusarium graminearum PH-1]CEF71879.1 unnamed protein product [Fusarium graminearum]|eukprot:XP_011315639.1 hypothetical protein FGSG_11661 [Fusarium graminearum PH-1]
MRSRILSIYRHRSHYRYIQGHFLFQYHPEDLTFDHPKIRPPTAIIRKPDDENPFTDLRFWGPYETEWLQDQDYAGFSYDQLRIFRQRAWIFCDNTRLYPPVDMHFPSTGTLAKQSFLAMNLGSSECNVPSRRRSPEWQDYWAGRTLESPSVYDEEVDEEELPWSSPVHIPSFYDSPHSQGLSTFWRQEQWYAED